MTNIRNYNRCENMLAAIASRGYISSGVSISLEEFGESAESAKLISQEIMRRNGFKVIWINSGDCSEAYARRISV